MDFNKIANEVLETEANELVRASNKNYTNWDMVVELITKAKGKVVIMGVGKSGLVGGKIAATLASTGTPSFLVHPTEAMHGDLGMIGKEDIVIAISNSGESTELTEILPHLKRFKIPLIGMTAVKSSTLAKYSDTVIDITISKEACPLGVAPMSSTTLTMAMGDAIATCMMKKRGFKKEDFASFHPGGSLGKKLFIRALDLAHKDNLPIVSHETSLKEAIVVMNEKRLGLVIVIENGNILAMLSDGDLRRSLMNKDFSLEANIMEYATKNPKTLDSNNLLASDALQFIEDNKIQAVLLTLDNKLVGLLHIHDLVEAGIS